MELSASYENTVARGYTLSGRTEKKNNNNKIIIFIYCNWVVTRWQWQWFGRKISSEVLPLTLNITSHSTYCSNIAPNHIPPHNEIFTVLKSSVACVIQ